MTQRLRQPTPSVFVQGLMSAGWSRRDAEALELVQLSLEHAHDPGKRRTWADRAATALRREPVLAGAIHLFGGDDSAIRAAWALYRAAPEGRGAGLAKLVAAARFD